MSCRGQYRGMKHLGANAGVAVCSLIFTAVFLCHATLSRHVQAVEAKRVSELKVNSGPTGDNQSPSTTILADGKFVVGWHQGGPSDCFGRVFSRDGSPVGAQFLLNPFTSSAWKYGPAFAPLPDGGFATFWGHSFGARGQRFDSRFNPAGEDFLFEPIGEPWPVITALANRDIVVVGDQQVAPYQIIAKRYNPSLVPYGSAMQVNVNSPGIRLFTSAIASAPNGNYTVAWYNSTGDIIARSFDSSDKPLGNEFKINSSTGGTRVRPSPGYTSRNELIVAWEGNGDGDSDGIYLRRFDSNGAPLGGEQRVNQIVTGSRSSASLVIGSKDEIVISWTAPDTSGTGVFARMYRFDAVPITGEFRVNQATSGNQWTPFFGGRRGNLIVDDRLMFTWAGSGAEGDGVYITIFPVSDVPQIATVSAASFKQPPGARESIVASFGIDLATMTASAPALPLPTTLAGTSVEVTDSARINRPARLFFVSPAQVNYQIPPETASGLATVAITSGNGTVSYGSAQIESVALGLFAANANGEGVAAAVLLRVKDDGSQSFESVARFDQAQGKFVPLPIDLGSETDQVFLILFGTGVRFRSSLLSVSASIGGDSAEVFYAGPQNDFIGLDQINLRLPRTLAGRGNVDIVLMADGKTVNTLQVNVR